MWEPFWKSGDFIWNDECNERGLVYIEACQNFHSYYELQ